jgi:hypothetical protein
MSGSAGVMSSHVAKPPKPAPSRISVMAAAGTSLARITPNKSRNEIRKCLIPRDFASAARSIAIAVPYVPGIQSVPASFTPAIAAASMVSATRSSGSRLRT